ncbi:hypothetical protein QFZ48_004293 [Chitinophaga sp. W2I13]
MNKWCTTKDKQIAFLKAVFKMPDIPLERIEYAFAEDFFDHMTLTKRLQDNSSRRLTSFVEIITINSFDLKSLNCRNSQTIIYHIFRKFLTINKYNLF